MKRRAASVRCSEEPVAGDGSMCAVSIAKREEPEPEAADGITITRRSPNKLLAADGAGIAATKRPRKPEKKKKKKKRRSKEEKNKRRKQPNQAEVVKHVSTEEQEQVMTELPENKKLVTREIDQAEMGLFLSEEVWSYVMSIGLFTFEDCTIHEIQLISDLSTEDIRHATRRRRIENQAELLRQYRTKGHVVFQYQVTSDEGVVESVLTC